MNKESIYQIIGYHGEYSESVKKALKKLLKENHPDLSGNEEIFKLVNEVKREIEENKVTYNYNEEKKLHKTFDDIDIDYCKEMIKSLNKKKEIKKKELTAKKEIISSLNSDYRKIYPQSIKKEEKLLDTKMNSKRLNNLKRRCLILLIILIITFFISLLKKNIILLVLFAFEGLGLLIIVYNLLISIKEMTNNNKKNVKDYIQIMKEIESINEEKEKQYLEIYNLKSEIKIIENDLRFYHNLLK